MIPEFIAYLYRITRKSPKELGKISNARVNQLLSPLCKNLFLSDDNYSTTSVDEANIFTKASSIESVTYTSEHDCDNFSFALNGYWSDSLYSFCFGVAWSGNHAFNLMIDDKEKIWICEPQNNMWFDLETIKLNAQYYPFRLILI